MDVGRDTSPKKDLRIFYLYCMLRVQGVKQKNDHTV